MKSPRPRPLRLPAVCANCGKRLKVGTYGYTYPGGVDCVSCGTPRDLPAPFRR